MKLETEIAISPHATYRTVGEEIVILDLESGVYFSLDPVGSRVWVLIAEGKVFREICEIMVSEYEVERAQLEEDVEALFNELANRGLVSLR